MSETVVERPVDKPVQMVARALRQHGRQALTNWLGELALVPVIVLLLIVGAFVNPAFLTPDNFINVAQDSAALGAVVVAETLILLTGKFDLSLQSTYGLAPMVRSEEHTSELQSLTNLVCRLLLEKKQYTMRSIE